MEKPAKHSIKAGKKEKPVAAKTGPVLPVLMNPHHTTPAAIAEYSAAFHAGTPFPHLLLQDAFPEEMLRAVRREVASFDFNQKGNDLYHFQQTDDLRTVQGNTTAALRDFIYTEQFRTWMAAITGIETNSTIDIFAAKYDDASYLLCHDDDLAQRRIAYIIYIVPDDWTEDDGGALDLFSVSKDADTVPDAVVRSMPPTFNAMAFFEVSAKSHHQVAEVLNGKKGPRMSISGWLHGKPIARPPPPPPPALKFICPEPTLSSEPLGAASPLSNARAKTGSTDELKYWVNPMYLKSSIIQQVRSQFAREGSIELPGFLKPALFEDVRKGLSAQRWEAVGPANMQHFKVSHDTAATGVPSSATGVTAYDSRMPGLVKSNGIKADVVSRAFHFLTSHQFLTYIAGIVQLELDVVAGRCRCFTQGDYTMITDSEYKGGLTKQKLNKISAVNPSFTDSEATAGAGAMSGSKRKREEAARISLLDAVLCCIEGEEMPEEHGGYTSYLTTDTELLTVTPKRNSLSIVLRAPEVMSFVKYVNHNAKENRNDFALHFRVAEEEDDE